MNLYLLKFISIIILTLSLLSNVNGQANKHPTKKLDQKIDLDKVVIDVPPNKVKKPARLEQNSFKVQSNATFKRPLRSNKVIQRKIDQSTGQLIFLKAHFNNEGRNGASKEVMVFDFLEFLKDDLNISAPNEEFRISKFQIEDDENYICRLEQYHNGIKIFGKEVIVHANDGLVNKFNGRYLQTPETALSSPKIDFAAAKKLALQDVSSQTTLTPGIVEKFKGKFCAPDESELVWFQKETKGEIKLAWYYNFHPNVREQWTYIVSAMDGSIFAKYKNSCSLHKHTESKIKNITSSEDKLRCTSDELSLLGPTTANAQDLLGITRTINTYETNGDFFMMDGSRSMFRKSQSNLPDEPVGAIWTLNASNTNVNNLTASHVFSSNNNWNNPTAVSAHFNGGESYSYFKNTHSRESINGSGGNIVSFINVADDNGGSLANAFWNGKAIFYGNGGQSFGPLARALDVAGHELSHGVVQSTANLIYQGQSGALNESFADIFGAMIDRDDWKIGEDVVSTSVFSSGALRDLQFPNNGGSSLSDAGWQPKNMNEYQNLPNTAQGDFGGVHINSGIPNHAYYQLADQIGKSKAEKIFYRALTNYMVRSSEFIDLRVAVEQAAMDIHGNGSAELTAVQNAFNIVMIGSGGGGSFEEEFDTNSGEDFILVSNSDYSELFVSTPDVTNITSISTTNHISKPHITDDGKEIVFIDNTGRMRYIVLDLVNGSTESTIQDDPIWRNVTISKDGSKIAAITDDQVNEIFVYDFNLDEGRTFTLFNPTFTQGQATGDVQYADVMEFDHTGEFILYDSYNKISSSFGTEIDYWDISFIQVWENTQNNWTDGQNIQKLFNNIPENTSIGNPTFAKDAPFIVAFDFINEAGDVTILATNIETGEQSSNGIFESGELTYPNYSIDDGQIIFDAFNQSGQEVIGIVEMQSDRLNPTNQSPAVFIEGGRWGNWFALGERELVSQKDIDFDFDLALKPNPSTDQIQLNIAFKKPLQVNDLSIFDLNGKKLRTIKLNQKTSLLNESIDVSTLASGKYLLQLHIEDQYLAKPFVKL